MSELKLALPECKYKNDADELLKNQFIFGIENKEIQDHLLGEISEADNSVRVLYEACKIESKLAQRKMLGIFNPSLVSMDAIKNRSKHEIQDCNYCGCTHGNGDCPAFGKICNGCGQKNHFEKKCRKNSSRSSEGSNSRKRLVRTNGRKCDHRCEVHEINDSCQSDNNTTFEDLTGQVQSLFY